MTLTLPFSEKKSALAEQNRNQQSMAPFSTLLNLRLESQNFFLLHLSILREYLQLEFDHLETSLDFTYDFERIIDDFILLAFFVGNDFLPNLPYLHINEGALALMFDIYKRVLPSCGGYINESGIINLDRLEIILIELEKLEYDAFEQDSSNQSWMRSKQTGLYNSSKTPSKVSPTIITPYQQTLVKQVKEFTLYSDDDDFDLPETLNAADRKFVTDMADALGLDYRSTTDSETGAKRLQLHFKEDFEPEEEGEEAMKRVFRKYERAQVSEQTVEEAEAAMERKYHEKFDEWKDDYYKVTHLLYMDINMQDKLHFSYKDENAVTAMAENYVHGLQWVLLYYYRGVPSWSWFYQYHYSPKITGILFITP
jgi:5'-3' exoribonuclease 1